MSYAAQAALYDGKGAYALQLAQKAVSEGQRVGHPLAMNFTNLFMAEVLLSLKKNEQALPFAQTALNFFRQLDMGQFLLLVLDINAEILSQFTLHDKDEIYELMAQAEDMVDRVDIVWFRINHLLSKARTSKNLKDVSVAKDCIALARDLYREFGLKNGTDQLRAIEKEIEEQASEGG